MWQHYALWLGCGGGVQLMGHRKLGQAQGWKSRNRAIPFLSLHLDPKRCLLLVHFVPQRSNLEILCLDNATWVHLKISEEPDCTT